LPTSKCGNIDKEEATPSKKLASRLLSLTAEAVAKAEQAGDPGRCPNSRKSEHQ
jgi:hypothetical protein